MQTSWLQELRRCILHLAEKYTRCQHHITFISKYIKQRKIPKGFRLKFHCNIANLEYEDKIKKCSLKLMQRTVSNYKRSVLLMKIDFDKICEKVNYFHSNYLKALNREIEKKMRNVAARQQKKGERDNIDVRPSNTPSLINRSTENENFRKKILATK